MGFQDIAIVRVFEDYQGVKSPDKGTSSLLLEDSGEFFIMCQRGRSQTMIGLGRY